MPSAREFILSVAKGSRPGMGFLIRLCSVPNGDVERALAGTPSVHLPC
jgi:hypothetical protein